MVIRQGVILRLSHKFLNFLIVLSVIHTLNNVYQKVRNLNFNVNLTNYSLCYKYFRFQIPNEI